MTAPDGRTELGSGGVTRRWIWFGVGWGFTALALIGVAVPLLPTTPFLILALWAFSRSSRRFHDWIVEHPLLGPQVRRWREERVVPMRVKLVALASMLASLGYVALSVRPPWYVLAAMGAVVAAAVGFLASVPSRPGAASPRKTVVPEP